MASHSYSSEGIILARRNYGEADRILSVYTKNYGRVSLIAKGIRRPASRKRGHVEVFSQIKFNAVPGRGIDLMTEAENIEYFSKIRKNLKKISLAYYFTEVIGRITHENERNDALYELILKYLIELIDAKELKKLRIDFIKDTLVLLGYWPDGKELKDADAKLEEVIERQIYSKRVGIRMVQ